jgi:crotonobetainyl-CoA:carnitine CoA-transferase CaiB-like acyl-CoA transferase
MQDLLQNDRYDTVKKRAEHVNEVLPRLHQALQVHSALEWEQIFGQDVPCAAARSVEDMFDAPQVAAEEMIATFDHPVIGRYRGFTGPIKFGRTPGPHPYAAPAFGQHTNDILGSMGICDDGSAEADAPPTPS